MKTYRNLPYKTRLNSIYGVVNLIFSGLILILFSCGDDDTTVNPNVNPQAINGTVIDESGNPYANVQINLQPGNEQTLTKPSGQYKFNDLTPGSYDLSIKSPKACEVEGGDSQSLDLVAGQTLNQDFILKLLPVDGTLVLDRNDPMGEIRNSQKLVPSDPEELIFRNHSKGLFPILAPDGHQMTLGEWSLAQGISRISCNGTTTKYNLEFEGLIPHGVYTIWNLIFASSKRPGDSLGDQIGGGALGNSDGSQNVFTASADGEGNLSAFVSGGSTLGFSGNQPNCALTDAPGFMLVVLYHIDGKSYGDNPGPPETYAAHLIFYY